MQLHACVSNYIAYSLILMAQAIELSLYVILVISITPMIGYFAGFKSLWALYAMMSKIKMAVIVGGLCTGSHWRG